MSVSLCGIELSNCLMNASGCWCRTEEELDDLNISQSGAIVSKSCTLHYRKGNENPRYHDNELGSINSMGMPNEGVDFYSKYGLHRRKPYIISVGALSIDETLKTLEFVKNYDLIELNVSCPNIVGKPQLGYDMVELDRYLDIIFSRFNLKIGLKLPPYFDPIHFEQVAEIIKKYPVKFITVINSLGNGLILKGDGVSIAPKGGLGGIGGDYCKPTALANVRQFYQLLKDTDIDIIGCGGIKSGRDVYEHILCGATAVQIGTHLVKSGTGCFSRILNELSEYVGNKSLNEIRGKLKVY